MDTNCRLNKIAFGLFFSPSPRNARFPFSHFFFQFIKIGFYF